jgi:hypothetical protein
MTSSIFTDWFHNCFIPHVEKFMSVNNLESKALLILDNAPVHKIQFNSNKMKVEFLPASTTALIQSIDQGIILALNESIEVYS